MQPNLWLPLTEYALRSGVSISTLRRKIKSNTIEYKMEDGRYLIRSDAIEESPAPAPNVGYASSDDSFVSLAHMVSQKEEAALSPPALAQKDSLAADTLGAELKKIQAELNASKDEGALRWRALEARVAGLAKKLEIFSEQMAEVKMLVKIFEEKLDERL